MMTEVDKNQAPNGLVRLDRLDLLNVKAAKKAFSECMVPQSKAEAIKHIALLSILKHPESLKAIANRNYQYLNNNVSGDVVEADGITLKKVFVKKKVFTKKSQQYEDLEDQLVGLQADMKRIKKLMEIAEEDPDTKITTKSVFSRWQQ